MVIEGYSISTIYVCERVFVTRILFFDRRGAGASSAAPSAKSALSAASATTAASAASAGPSRRTSQFASAAATGAQWFSWPLAHTEYIISQRESFIASQIPTRPQAV